MSLGTRDTCIYIYIYILESTAALKRGLDSSWGAAPPHAPSWLAFGLRRARPLGPGFGGWALGRGPLGPGLGARERGEGTCGDIQGAAPTQGGRGGCRRGMREAGWVGGGTFKDARERLTRHGKLEQAPFSYHPYTSAELIMRFAGLSADRADHLPDEGIN